MHRTVLLKYTFLFFFFFFLFINCATRKAPTGGPVDRTPPQVVKTIPAHDSLFVTEELKQIEIIFSERMEQASLARNIYISPPLGYEIDWESWKKALIKLDEPLLTDQTYVISIASGVQDLRKNGMAESYQFAFSTGYSLDHNSIRGKIHGLEKNAAINLYAFILDPGASFRPDTLKPMYITKSGKNGEYRLAYMKDGLYRVIAVEEQNNNLLLDADFEKVGLSIRDVQLDSVQSKFEKLDFVLTENDTTGPKLLSIRPVYRDLIEVRLTEPVTDSSIQSFTIIDSSSHQNLPIRMVRPDREFKNILKVITAVHDSNATYRFQSDALRDSLFNSNDSVTSFYYHPKTAEDSVTFRLISHFPKDSSLNNHPTDNIQLEFSTPISVESLNNFYTLKDHTGHKVSGTWKFNTLTQAQFQPTLSLIPDSAYYSIINTDSLKDLRGKMLADSAISYYFSIVSSRELGEVSGQIQFEQITSSPVILQLKPLDKKRKKFQIAADESGRFYERYIPDGKYLIEGWLDEDRNGRYSAGTIFPFQFSEPFSTSGDTVNVRKRWETENIILQMPVPERNYESTDSLYQN